MPNRAACLPCLASLPACVDHHFLGTVLLYNCCQARLAGIHPTSDATDRRSPLAKKKNRVGGTPGYYGDYIKRQVARLAVGTESVCPVTVARGREGSRAYFVGTHAHIVYLYIHTHSLQQGHRDVSFCCLPLLLYVQGKVFHGGWGWGWGRKLGWMDNWEPKGFLDHR